MIGCFKKTREEIVQIIKKSQITEDGFYVCKNFIKLNSALGDKLEKKYKYGRYYFENKICFSQADIEIYLEEYENDFNINDLKRRDDYLYTIIKEDVDLSDNIYERVPGCLFTLSELVDTAIFVYNSKYK